MAQTANLTATPIEAAAVITNALGTAVQTVYTAPAASSTGTGGAKITRLTAITNDTTTASVYVQISKLIGGVSTPVGDPVAVPVATAKGTFNSNAVDLLTELYGAAAAMNLGPGTVLQAALSVAPAAGKTITVLAEGATF